MIDSFSNCPVWFPLCILLPEVEALPVLFEVSYNPAVDVCDPVIVIDEIFSYLPHPDCAVITNIVEIGFPDDNGVIFVTAVFGIKILYYAFPASWQDT